MLDDREGYSELILSPVVRIMYMDFYAILFWLQKIATKKIKNRIEAWLIVGK